MRINHCFTASVILLFSLFISSPAQAQKEDSLIKKSLTDSLHKYVVRATPMIEDGQDLHVFEKVDVEASVDMMKWRRQLEKHLQAPVKKAAKNGMKAGYYTVLVRFLVEKDGSIGDVKALNDPGYELAEASVNVVKSGPRWTPGEQNGRKVRSYCTQPITFVISEK
jgi:protein TonB